MEGIDVEMIQAKMEKHRQENRDLISANTARQAIYIKYRLLKTRLWHSSSREKPRKDSCEKLHMPNKQPRKSNRNHKKRIK